MYISLLFYKDHFGIKLPTKVDMPLKKNQNQPLCTSTMWHKVDY